MAEEGVVTVYNPTIITDTKKNTSLSVKIGQAQMLRNGVIIEVLNPQQGKIAEQAGACAVVVIDHNPNKGGISRMPDPSIIKSIKQSVSIPVMANTRIGHFVEAQILESIGVDFIDENDALAAADDENHINKHNFNVPFVCGSQGLGEALNRVREGAALIRTHGGDGNIGQTVKNVRSVMRDLRSVSNMDEDEVFTFAKNLGAPYDVVAQTKQMRRLPVVHFAGGGIVTPADAALMMQLGCDGVFVGNEVFMGCDSGKRVEGMVKAVMHYKDPHVLAGLMMGLNVNHG